MLTPLILQNAALLRALVSAIGHPSASVPILAAATDRDASNVRKSLKALEADGLVAGAGSPPAWAITNDGRKAVAALDRAEGEPAPAVRDGEIPTDLIDADPTLNPRQDFDEADLAELAASVRDKGVLQPILLRPAADPSTGRYRIVAGERRWRAAVLAGLAFIPATVRDLTDAEALQIALIENMVRRDLKPLDEARTFKRLIDDFGFNTAAIAEKINCGQRMVQQRLQLLELDADEQARLADGKITIEDARRLVAAKPKLREDLTPADWLLLLEIADRSITESTGDDPDGEPLEPTAFDDLICRRPPPDVERRLGELADYRRKLLHVRSDHLHGVETGRIEVGLWRWNECPAQLRLRFGDLADADTRAAALAALRAELGHTGLADGAYANDWLNGPFDIAPDVQAKAEARRKELADDAERAEARRKFEAETMAARRKVVEAMQADAADWVLNPVRPEFAEIAGQLHNPLPWFVDDDGGVWAANGARVSVFDSYAYGETPWLLRRLAVIGLNAAAGFATPAVKPGTPAEPETPTRAEFVEVVAGWLLETSSKALTEERADAMAEAGLKAYLAQEGVEYGDGAYDWQEDGAVALAKGILNDGFGQTPPADDADTVDPDPEIPTTLKRLAGIPEDAPELEGAE